MFKKEKNSFKRISSSMLAADADTDVNVCTKYYSPFERIK